jgi:hypothetical protein
MWIKNLPQIKLELGAAEIDFITRDGFDRNFPLLQDDSAFQAASLSIVSKTRRKW